VIRARRRESGVVLVMVLVFLLLMVSSVFAFQRRAVLDSTIVQNRDALARAEALARGGVRLAWALLLEDRLRESQGALQAETPYDVWARAENLKLPLDDDAELHLHIEDTASRLNLNALFADGVVRDTASETLLVALLDYVIRQAAFPPERQYDPRELARNLIDWVDADQASLRGGLEDDVYQRQDPPYRAANRPFLSLDELGLVEGFDAPLVEALRPYLTVYPYVNGGGIDPNTAPPWVLAVLYHGAGGDYRLADPTLAEDLVRLRDRGRLLCGGDLDDPLCAPLAENVPGDIYPPPTFSSNVFRVRAEARVGSVTRTLETVLDRSDPNTPLVLAWKME
jgi:type II secretory pathway component PulK